MTSHDNASPYDNTKYKVCKCVCVLLACLPTDDTHLNTHTAGPHDKGTGGPLILFFYSLLHWSPSHDVCVCVSTLKYTVCTLFLTIV